MQPDLQSVLISILRIASQPRRRPDFVREVTRTILELSTADSVELWQCAPKFCFCGEHARLADPQLRLHRGASAGGEQAQFRFENLARREPGRPRGLRQICLERLHHKRNALAALSQLGYSRRAGKATEKGAELHELTRGRAGRQLPGALLFVSFSADRDSRGFLLLKSKSRAGLPAQEVSLLAGLGETIGVAMSSRDLQATLRERVKELTCLYEVARLAQAKAPLDHQLQGIVELLPPAWHHPELASSCIAVDGRSYRSRTWRDGPSRQRAEIAISGERRGFIEVVYCQALPEVDEGPFLVEERNLVNALARHVALLIERHQADEEKDRLQEQLRHADRLATIGELAAGVAHELNEPLGSILGFAQLAQKSDLPETVGEDLTKIVAASLHAREVIKKLMLFARQTPPRKALVDLNQLVDEGAFFLEARCAREGIELRRRLARKLPPITADASLIQQVIVNLAVNGIQAMPSGGTLTIRTARRARHVSLVVEDTGVGMSAEVRARAFVPFFTTKELGKGTGLGLSVVHGIVTSHGGSVAVESEPGAGSRFEVRLPAAERSSR